jgi:hypothetical protein
MKGGKMNIKTIAGPVTWAFLIIIGVLMLTPGGIVPISTNPAIRIAVGLISIALGAVGFVSMRGKSAGG